MNPTMLKVGILNPNCEVSATMKSYRAKFLVAIPELIDSNFFRSVVLMFHHDEDGASGLILNRPSPVKLTEVWDQISDLDCNIDQPLFFGGPVEGPLMAIHGCASHSEIEIMEGMYLSMRKENLDEIISQTLRPFRFFSGYSGWSSEQLESEVEAGGWLVEDAAQDDVFGDHENLWKKLSDRFGQKVMFPGRDQWTDHDPLLN